MIKMLSATPIEKPRELRAFLETCNESGRELDGVTRTHLPHPDDPTRTWCGYERRFRASVRQITDSAEYPQCGTCCRIATRVEVMVASTKK